MTLPPLESMRRLWD